MNELVYSFIGSLRAWLHENEGEFRANNINATMPAYTFYSGTRAEFTSEHFEAGFYVWEKGHWHLAMSDIEFVDWRIASQDPDYDVEFTHYEYATIGEMFAALDTLKRRLLLVHQPARSEENDLHPVLPKVVSKAPTFQSLYSTKSVY